MVAVRQLCFHCAYSWHNYGCFFGAGGGAASAYGATYNYNEPNHRNSIALHAIAGGATTANSYRSRFTTAFFSLSDERIRAAAATTTTTTTAVAATWHPTFLDYGCLEFYEPTTFHGIECAF